MNPAKPALLIGNTDGIGLAVTRKLLDAGRRVVGLSRSPAPLHHDEYIHHVQNVAEAGFLDALEKIQQDEGPFDPCIYFAGIGHTIDMEHLDRQRHVFEVNLMGLVKTAEVVIPAMGKAGGGHFIGLSSIADVLITPEAASYCASKAGMTGYLNGLGLHLRKKERQKNIHITNIRFGYVDTKMAEGPVRPMMIPAEKAARLVLRCMEKKPIQFTYPKPMGLLTLLLRALTCVRTWFP